MPQLSIEELDILRRFTLLNAHTHSGKAQAGAVIGKVLSQKPDLKIKVKELSEEIMTVVSEVNQLSTAEQLSELRLKYPDLLQERSEKYDEKSLPPLLNAVSGKVITRFPPEPNGYPHIGHAKAAIINETYARTYNGRLILRFDDTNPAKEKSEYYHAILEGLKWLGIKPDTIKNTSDDLDTLYKYADDLITKNCAYVCTCDILTVRTNRAKGDACGCRSKDTEIVVRDWERMFNKFKPNEAILRLRGDMKNTNTVMRDPTLFRLIDAEHPLKGRQYRVWPTYDFSVAIEDSLDGVTHAMRTKEYELRDELYFTILTILGLRKPELIEFSRLEFKGTPVSKRRLKPLIDDHLVQGWDDPRLPTLVALKRRGITAEAIRHFILSMGVSKTESKPTWDILESFNRKILDPTTRRYFFIPNPINLQIKGAPAIRVKLKNHPGQNLGERHIDTKGEYSIASEDVERLNVGDVFRLIELYNVRVDRKSENGIEGSFVGNDLSNVRMKIQWVTDKHIKLKILIPTSLFVDGVFNSDSLVEVNGLGEESIAKLPVGSITQFVRFGFCRIDSSGTAILTHK